MKVQRKDVIKKIKEMKATPARKDGVFILLDEIEREGRTPAGIITLSQTTAQEGTREGTVMGVGRAVQDVKVDDRVLIGKYFGTEVFHDDSQACRLILVSEDQIDALIE